MPASMMSAPPVGMEYVSGSNSEMVASGPRPGNRPTSVPTTHPMAQYIRLLQVSACSKPNARLCRISIVVSSSASVKGQLQAEALLESEPDQDQAGRNLHIARDRIGAGGEGRNKHHRDDAGDHVDQLRDDREEHQASEDEADVPVVEVHLHLRREARADHGGYAHQQQQD